MKKLVFALAAIMTGGLAQADNLDGVSRMLCAAAQVQICIENDICYTTSTHELDVPDFVVIDTDKKTISTTKASQLNRSTSFTSFLKSDGVLYLQGVEGGRAFSFVIDVETGRLTVAVARDGFAVSVFGVCTDAKL
ncbi:MAG: hypothetical protein OEW73_08335 [Gammaproteobacteria bacterium]|nr:hypothetical protein [Gammaproteobacteria bacterium]MDH5240773.1 hypothetical protein [Gammaproteobacteria bacterium]MDH5260784.1 hypothetical protein [Gammaproteobacteria bacterium]MDH5583276.1 hypothetical protein [Gammaproteobacteria bacterium]